uniref:DUF4100 domain-containing protein n=1 Tax=Moniliophthora roreri TaxID=221103 RepID=A0A0W0FDC2_MONRR
MSGTQGNLTPFIIQTPVSFMPIPGSPNAPIFTGERVQTFLDVIRCYADAAGLTEDDKVNQIYYYSSNKVQDTIRNSAVFNIDKKNKTWEAASKKLLSLYGSSDQAPTVTLASLQAFCQKQSSKPAFASKQAIEKYVHSFETYSSTLVKARTISQSEANYYFILGLPDMLKHWLETQIPADKMTKVNAPTQEEVLTLLNRRFDPLSLFYMLWREEDEEGDAEETPLATNGVPQSALDSLTEQMRQLQLNQTSILNALSSMGTLAPQQSDCTYNRTKTCFICRVQDPPHPLHPTKCPESASLVREGLIKFDAQRGRFVMMNRSDLPWTPYSGYQGGIAAYIHKLHNLRSATQASQSGFMRDPPPHQQASVNHYGLFCDGSPVFSEEGFNFNGEQFSSNPVLRGGKDTGVRFDPLARPDTKTGDSKAKKKSTSDHLPKPSTRPDITNPLKTDTIIDIPAPPLPINRKDGWKDSVPSAGSKPKPDITMKDDNRGQSKYHFTLDLQEKSDLTTIYNAVMNQPITVPIYQLIGNSPALQKLISDGTRMRREYVTKQAEYSFSNPVSSSEFDKTNVTEVMMMMVDAEGVTCCYQAADLNAGDVESVYEFLGRCANALLKSPEASKLFAMVTGILELTINGVTLSVMIDTGSELSVGSQDLPDKTNCAVDFGGRNWSLKGIHRQPEPLQGVMVEAMMKIGGQDFPHHIFISHQNMDKQDIILGQPFLVWYGTHLQYHRSGHVKLYLWEDPENQKQPSISISITNPKDPHIKVLVNAAHYFVSNPSASAFRASVEEVEDEENEVAFQ